MTLFILTWSLWFLSEILLNRLVRSGSTDKKKNDQGSIHTIWITIGIANTSGILCAILTSVPIGSSIAYAGLLIIAIGMIVRFIAILSLGRLFTVDVTIRKDHYLKKDGIYRYIRHPSYTGSLISFFGFGMSLNNWISLVVIFIPFAAAMLYRIKSEEQVLSAEFGQEYTNYCKNSYRLLPWIY